MRTLEVGEEVDGRRVEEVVGAIEVVAHGLVVTLFDLLQKTNGSHQRFHALKHKEDKNFYTTNSVFVSRIQQIFKR